MRILSKQALSEQVGTTDNLSSAKIIHVRGSMLKPVVKSPTEFGGGEAVELPFIHIVYQSGLPTEVGVNGCRVEDVISVVVDKLERFQQGPLACDENSEAIRYLKLAKLSMLQRIQRRQEQGVWNTMHRHAVIRTEDEHDDFSSTGA